MHPELLIPLYAVVAGLVVGSYLNVLIYRLPRAKPTVASRSCCPFCGGSIRALDNIPLLSFALLRGRCRRCGGPISWRYPVVEALTAALFVLCLQSFGLSLPGLIAALFGCLMLLLAAIDLEHLLLPDKITLPGIVAGLALQPWSQRVEWLDALIGTLAGAGVLILLINFWYWLRSEEGMGMGDVNMLAMVGAFLGWKGALTALSVAAISGAMVGIGLLVAGRLRLRSRLPFGVFLALGGLVALFLGDRLVDSYLRFL